MSHQSRSESERKTRSNVSGRKAMGSVDSPKHMTILKKKAADKVAKRNKVASKKAPQKETPKTTPRLLKYHNVLQFNESKNFGLMSQKNISYIFFTDLNHSTQI